LVTRNRTRAERLQATKLRKRRHPGAAATSRRTAAAATALPQLRTSERSSFKRCRWQWYWGYVEERSPFTPKPALRFGSLIHRALAVYYKPGVRRGPHPAITFEKFYEEELKTQAQFGVRDVDQDDKWVEAGDLGVAMLNNYIDTYGKDDEWEVLATEKMGSWIVYDPDTFDPNHPPEAQATAVPLFEYVFTLDGVWRSRRTKKLWIPDHKTTSANRVDTRYLRLDDQASAYWTWGVDWLYANGHLKSGQELAGMLFNYLRKSAPDDRPRNEKGQCLNKDGSVSKNQPSPYFVRQPVFRDEYERNETRERAVQEFKDMQAVRAGQAHPYKSPSMMNCPHCWLLDICELHEVGADYMELVEGTSMVWSPYSDYEIEGERT